MKYDDLLMLPYEPRGRYGITKGLDCYGLVLECAKRNGTPLKDVVYPTENVPAEGLDTYSDGLNLTDIDRNQAHMGDIVLCEYQDNLHTGFLLSSDMVIHASRRGVRITPITCFQKVKFMRITECR